MTIEQVIKRFKLGKKITFMDCWGCEKVGLMSKGCKYRMLVRGKLYCMAESEKIDPRMFN